MNKGWTGSLVHGKQICARVLAGRMFTQDPHLWKERKKSGRTD